MISLNNIFGVFEYKIDSLIDTAYFDRYSKIVDEYTKFLLAKDEFNISSLQSELRRLHIKSTFQFFKNLNKKLRPVGERISLDDKLRLYPFENCESLDVNRYNYERNLEISKMHKVNINNIEGNKGISVKEVVAFPKSVIMITNGDNKVSRIVVLKHMYSVEYYDAINHKTLAYKNYVTNEKHGLWVDNEATMNNITASIICGINEKTKVSIKLKIDTQDKKDNKISISPHHFNKLNFELIAKLGPNTRAYREEILDTAIKLFNRSYGTDMESRVENSVSQAINIMTKNNVKIAKAMIEDAKEREIEYIKHQKELKEKKEEEQRRLARLQKEREERQLRERREHELRQRRLVDDYFNTFGEKEKAYAEAISSFSTEYAASCEPITLDVSSKENISKRVSELICGLEITNNLRGTDSRDAIKTYELLYKTTERHIDYNIVSKMIDEKNITELENYLKTLYKKSFVSLVNRRYLDEIIKINNNIIAIYKEYGGTQRFKTGRQGVTSEFHNSPESRGFLNAYGGRLILGGNNKVNQGSYELKISNEALHDLCRLIGKPNPNSSELNKYIEENVLKDKSQREDAFRLNPIAIQTFSICRDRNQFTQLKQLDNTRKSIKIYIPCEYNAYLKYLLELNGDNEILKKSCTSIMNILIYEHLMSMTGKDYSR